MRESWTDGCCRLLPGRQLGVDARGGEAQTYSRNQVGSQTVSEDGPDRRAGPRKCSGLEEERPDEVSKTNVRKILDTIVTCLRP